MALLLHHRRRRLLCTILPCELPLWRVVSLHCSYGVQLQPVGRALNYRTIGKIPGSIASDAPILSNSHTFSCFIVTGSVMLGLLATVDGRHWGMIFALPVDPQSSSTYFVLAV